MPRFHFLSQPIAIAIFLFAVNAIASGCYCSADQPLIGPNDRIAIVGGTLIERMRNDPSLEYELQTRKPDWKLRLRNLGWSGDDTYAFARKLFDPNPEKGFQRLQFDLDLAAPTVVLLAYGFAEASNGADAVAKMEPGLTRLVESMLQKQRRVILMHPIALPGILTPGYTDHIRSAGEVIDRVAMKFELPVVKVSCEDFADDGLLPNEAGYRDIARQLTDALAGPRGDQPENSPSTASPHDPALAGLILKKEELFFHRHRPQNETYLLLFRKHEQGNNAVELAQFDPLVDAVDQEIWKKAQQVTVRSD
ncbi:MAG TPA: hypothetical protein DDZ51_03620 [Planctomycetaceae bacterium]|nr:hypothetical protein [Planctomycetaceae bacterium]